MISRSSYWYDPRHELGNYVANVDLRVRNLDTNAIVTSSTDAYDNKERVFYSSAGNKRLSIELVGTNLIPTEFYQTCSVPGKIRVNVAWFYEDDARDDLFSWPGYDPGTYIGVESE